MDAKLTHRRAGTRRSRPAAWAALVAAVLALVLSAVPGTASAATTRATPLFDCSTKNSDESVTVVLGYSSTYATPQTFQAGGSSNYTTPVSYTSMPSSFSPGTYHLATSLTFPHAVWNRNPTWVLDGTTLDMVSAARNAPTCSASQLPALANGAAFAAGLLLVAGVVGLVVLRRVRRTRLAGGTVDGAA